MIDRDRPNDSGGLTLQSATGRIAAFYIALAVVAVLLALALREGVPWNYPKPWLKLVPPLPALSSAGSGLLLAWLLVYGTRLTVVRYRWAQRLHSDLRPLARGLSTRRILALAVLSSLGEELLFRGLLLPWIGWIPAAILFGLAHQMPGPSRWVWVLWATLVGLAFGALFAATGSLIGPLLAHGFINAINLAYLRDHDPELSVD